MWAMPSSFFCAAMISSLNMGVRMMLHNNRSGNTRVLDSSPVRWRTTVAGPMATPACDCMADHSGSTARWLGALTTLTQRRLGTSCTRGTGQRKGRSGGDNFGMAAWFRAANGKDTAASPAGRNEWRGSYNSVILGATTATGLQWHNDRWLSEQRRQQCELSSMEDGGSTTIIGGGGWRLRTGALWIGRWFLYHASAATASATPLSQWEHGAGRHCGWLVGHARQHFLKFNKPKIGSQSGKNSWKGNKDLEKYMGIEDPIWNNFCYCSFLKISMDFEWNRRFCFKFELPKNGPLRLIVTLGQLHHSSNFDKELPMVIYKFFSLIWLTCTA
jgi:hypothetical protein